MSTSTERDFNFITPMEPGQSQFVGPADDFSRTTHFDLAVLQRGHDQAERSNANLVARPHGVLHLFDQYFAHIFKPLHCFARSGLLSGVRFEIGFET